MDANYQEFISDPNAQSDFVEKLSSNLGIDTSLVTIIDVYEGSVVIVYDIKADPESGLTLDDIQETQAEKFASGEMDLGAPILDVQS